MDDGAGGVAAVNCPSNEGIDSRSDRSQSQAQFPVFVPGCRFKSTPSRAVVMGAGIAKMAGCVPHSPAYLVHTFQFLYNGVDTRLRR